MRDRNAWRWPLYAALLVLYLLHNDLWLWNDASLVFGLPVGLVYHVGFAVATSIVLTLLVLKAWPHHLEVPDSPASETHRREGRH
ncbi:MAG TPA: DUF3311 domain-containing protein [Thermoanaerobaculia bacterium]